MLHAALSELPATDRECVERELAPGERVVWARPAVPRFFTGAAFGTMLVGVPFTAFAVFWTYLALGAPYPGKPRPTSRAATGAFDICFPMWGVMFVVIGLVQLAAPIHNRAALGRTLYVVTDRRALSIRRTLRGRIEARSFAPELVASLERTERGDGSGDLIFESYRVQSGKSSRSVRNGFISVADVRGVEAILRQTLLAPSY